jgi:ATP-dependent Clp endopeptidase proteolytic subunit ClpP
MATTAKAQLEREKLEQEIRKIRAEADAAELEAISARRVYEQEEASEYENHIYAFYNAVRGGSVEECMTELGSWSRRHPGCPIQVIFNSPGGSVIDGLALYDFLRTLSNHGHRITTMAIGMAASMGGVLLQAGDYRVMSRNAHMLIHEVSSGAVGKVAEMKDEVEFSNRLWRRLSDILAARSSLSALQIRRKAERKDWWFDAHVALELGFVDEVR